jgi:hypothetical protein
MIEHQELAAIAVLFSLDEAMVKRAVEINNRLLEDFGTLSGS